MPRKKNSKGSGFGLRFADLAKQRQRTLSSISRAIKVPTSTLCDWQAGVIPSDFNALHRRRGRGHLAIA